MSAVVTFLASCAAILYVLAGYPLLLAYVARRGRTIQRSPILPSIAIVIPVYNGEAFLKNKLRSVLALEYPHDKMEILVVSDGSTDSSESIAREFVHDGVGLLTLPRGGKPTALNAAIAQTRGEILILTDVRQPLAADSVKLLVESFADPSVGAVSGELVIGAGSSADAKDIGLYWRFELWIRDRLSRLDSMFGATGAFYAIRRELAPRIPADILLDDMYLPLSAFFQGYRVVLDRRALAYDIPSDRATEFYRKVRTLAGNYQILRAYPALLGPRNRMWIHVVSYKLARLLLPWLLVAVAVSSFGLPDPWRILFISGQGLFYLIAATDDAIPPKFPLKRISSPARTFVTMMIAAVRGLVIFFVPARTLWKVTSASSSKLTSDR
jgi:cellulose synthase/poly-beta-1,6-N-acetylglucosamine synthase-like glycosyltransferase